MIFESDIGEIYDDLCKSYIEAIIKEIEEEFESGTTTLALDGEMGIIEQYGMNDFVELLREKGFELEVQSDELIITKV